MRWMTWKVLYARPASAGRAAVHRVGVVAAAAPARRRLLGLADTLASGLRNSTNLSGVNISASSASASPAIDYDAAKVASLMVGPARYCSPRHWMPFNSLGPGRKPDAYVSTLERLYRSLSL